MTVDAPTNYCAILKILHVAQKQKGHSVHDCPFWTKSVSIQVKVKNISSVFVREPRVLATLSQKVKI